MPEAETIRVSDISSSDRRMDILDSNQPLDTPINQYSVKCEVCKFPDIDAAPNPYFLAKDMDFSGIEITAADVGNLFVSDRVKQIFKILLPDQCMFQKTYIQNTQVETKWWLAIPTSKVTSGEVYDNIPRCKTCNEPLSAHPGSQYKFWVKDFESSSDILKSRNWHSIDEVDWKKSWLSRDIFVSVRLRSLLKTISAKGIYGTLGSKYKSLTKDEKTWVSEAIGKIGELREKVVRIPPNDKDVSHLMAYFMIPSLNNRAINSFEQKTKFDASKLLRVILSVPYNTKIQVADREYLVRSFIEMKKPVGRGKLLMFADDEFGNSLFLNPKDALLPIYFYDHETMIYELIFSSILDLLVT